LEGFPPQRLSKKSLGGREIDKQKLYRIIDANFNRAKEGLRVCEDVCRFVWDRKKETKALKDIRHHLTQVIGSLTIRRIIQARNIRGDVGRFSTVEELKRKDVADVYYANSQRVKESIRVLEEFSKILDANAAQALKKLRYRIYAVEKDIIKEL